jgi:GTP cyclohydrolase II
MPDVIQWLGVRRLDRFVSMSDLKYNALVGQGIEVVERVALPEQLVPADAHVEMAAKKAAGYFSPEPLRPAEIGSTGRTLEKY